MKGLYRQNCVPFATNNLLVELLFYLNINLETILNLLGIPVGLPELRKLSLYLMIK